MGKNNGKEIQELTDVTVMFAGDSGDGMQLTGTQFSDTAAFVGNDLSTLPDYPAEIRAPIGTTYGVSGFQLHFGSSQVFTPGDNQDVLVAMNPAALKVNLPNLKNNGIIIVNSDSFDKKNLKLAKFETNPLEDNSLAGYRVFPVAITSMTIEALKDCDLKPKEVARSKNFFALGIMYWLFNRPLEPTLEWVSEKFGKSKNIVCGNSKALKAGFYYGENTELFASTYLVAKAELPKGTYKSISGKK